MVGGGCSTGTKLMKLLIGLGNPGNQYSGHRHNVGFMALDEIARQHTFPAWRKKFRAEITEGMLDGTRVLLIKPQTYMNESGRSVSEAMRFYKLEPSDVIVFHDELDLVPGKIRVKTGGGAAGHNGLRSIIQQIGADYVRVRIGIGHPGHKDRVHGYVLSDFARADRPWLEPLLDEMARAAGHLAAGNGPRFMSEVARHLQPVKRTKTEATGKPAATTAKKQTRPAQQNEQPETKRPVIGQPAGPREHKLAKWDFVEKMSSGEGAFADKLKGLFRKDSGDDNGEN